MSWGEGNKTLIVQKLKLAFLFFLDIDFVYVKTGRTGEVHVTAKIWYQSSPQGSNYLQEKFAKLTFFEH